jgi:adenine-specific DNA-methyltransferase
MLRDGDIMRLDFKGKDFVHNHHLSIPHRPLEEVTELAINPSEDFGVSNLIIQGDNLYALKTLIPSHEGRIDCVFIDPPYNTGNEGWCYNDNVDSPMIREWLDSNPIGVEDWLRHDKWCAMMWPRLRMLHQLMAEDGIFIMHIDENEHHNAIAMLKEIFGRDSENPDESNVLGSIVWDKRNPKGDSKGISYRHEQIIIAAKCKTAMLKSKPMRKLKESAEMMIVTAEKMYQKIGTDTIPSDLANVVKRYSLDIELGKFQISWDIDNVAREFKMWVNKNPNIPSGVKPYKYISTEGLIYRRVHMGWPNSDDAPDDYCYPIIHPITGKECPSPAKGWRMPQSTLETYFGGQDPIEEPNGDIRVGEILFGKTETKQPERRYLLHEQTYENIPSILSYGGSDNDYLDSIGIEFDFPKPHKFIADLITYFTNENDIILDSFAGSGTTGHATMLANQNEGGDRKFILVEMEDYARNCTARRIAAAINGHDTIEPLEGNYRYFTLGDALELNALLAGESLPDYDGLGQILYHIATNQTLDSESINEDSFYLGETEDCHVWMIYKNDLDWLKSPASALTLEVAKDFAQYDCDKRHIVIAPAKYVSQKMLDEQNIPVEFVPLAYSLFSI